MPNDENTQQTQQNQNSVVDSNTSANTGNSDDFDFSFDSELGSGIPSDQGQVVTQGRTGMFLTPDEEAEKEELKNSGQQVSQVQPENISEEDPALGENSGSYFPNVNVNNNVETENSNENTNVDVDSSNDKFDDKIENLISFDDDNSVGVGDVPVSGNEVSSVNGNSEVSVPESAELGGISLQNQQTNSNVENDIQNVQNNGESTSTSNVVNDGGNSNQGDDWLKQEDKKVEETFGQESVENNQNMEVDESPAEVAQNVENMFNTTVSNNENVLGQNAISNVGVDNTLLPDGLGKQTDLQQSDNNYVPNEADFSAMSNMLNSSNVGQVDLNNVDNQQDNPGLIGDLRTLNTEASFTPDLTQVQGNGVDAGDNSNAISEPQNVQVSIDSQPVVPDLNNNQEQNLDNSNLVNSDITGVQIDQVDSQTQENLVNQGIDLNSMGILGGSELGNSAGVIENQGMPLDVILDQEIQNMHVQPQNLEQTNIDGTNNDINQTQPQNVQVQAQGKRKKQSGFVVLGIVGGIIILGALGYFVVTKMFPDKFNMKNLIGGDPVVEYVTGNEPTGDVENNNNQLDENVVTLNEDVDDNGQGDENGEGAVESNETLDGNNVEGIENNIEGNEVNENGEDLDPNSLAGQLLSDENETGEANGNGNNNLLGGEENVENNGLDEDEVTDDNGGTNEDEFDPFTEIDNILGDEKSDSDKLNEYIEQGNYYKALRETNGNKKMKIYGEYIIATATEELSKLENGEEIDNTIFSKLDEVLETLQSLEN